MQASLAIVTHALRMLIFETGTTLRVLLPALALIFGSSLLAVFLAPEAMALLMQGAPEDMAGLALPDGSFLLIGFALLLAAITGYILMAILWHRHVLLSGMERERIISPSARIFFSYLGRALLVGLVQLLAAVPVTLMVGALAALGGGGALIISLATLLGGVIFSWIGLRISLILPAAAVAAPMTIPDSWEATGRFNGPILGLALIVVLLNLALSTLALPLLGLAGGLAIAFQTALYVVEGLIFISILTTLYGHLVEGRALG